MEEERKELDSVLLAIAATTIPFFFSIIYYDIFYYYFGFNYLWQLFFLFFVVLFK